MAAVPKEVSVLPPPVLGSLQEPFLLPYVTLASFVLVQRRARRQTLEIGFRLRCG